MDHRRSPEPLDVYARAGRQVHEVAPDEGVAERGAPVGLHPLEDVGLRGGHDVRPMVGLGQHHPPLRSHDPRHLVKHLPRIVGVDEHSPDPARIEAVLRERQLVAVGVHDRSGGGGQTRLCLAPHRKGAIQSDHMSGVVRKAGEVGTGAAAEIEHPVLGTEAQLGHRAIGTVAALVGHPADVVPGFGGAVDPVEAAHVDQGRILIRHSRRLGQPLRGDHGAVWAATVVSGRRYGPTRAGWWASVHSAVVLGRRRAVGGDDGVWDGWPVAGAVLGLLVAAPLVVSGPGNDLDVANVFRSGRAIARHLSYVPSRPPGAPVHEAIVGVLDVAGGPLLTNLASLAAAAGLLVALDRLLRREGIAPGGRWAVALIGANPWFVIAATSTADYIFALLFVVLAASSLRRGYVVRSGLFAAAAMGCRIGSGALIVAVLLAELLDRELDVTAAARTVPEAGATTVPDAPGRRRRVLIAAAVAAGGTMLLFVPALLSTGGLSFAENNFSTSSPFVQAGRALAKDLNLLGTVGTAIAVVALPALVDVVRRWGASWLVRFASMGFVMSQALFLRFPWKMAHLLPSLLCLAILLAVALDAKPRLLMALVAVQLLFCTVRVDVIRPDDPNQATGGRAGLSVGWGPVVNDWRCRREHADAYRGRQKVEVEAAWVCAGAFGRTDQP